MTDFFQDLRYAVRMLVRQPAFTLVTVLVLSVGIGATTAIFSVVDAVLLRPLPYPDADRIVSVTNFIKRSGLRGTVSAPDFHDWHDQARSFAALAMYQSGPTSVSVDGAADYAVVSRATPEFLAAMGARTSIGRLPSDEEQRPNGPMTVVVSDAFWRSRLGADPAALGRTIKYSVGICTVVGVLTPEFNFPANTAIWAPWWTAPETTSRSAHNYRVVGRLAPNVSLAQAQAELGGIADRLAQQYPQSNEGKGVAVDRLLDNLVRNIRTTLNLIFAVVVVVLLIACANVSNLLLARASSRTRELGVRAAIGATRGRVVRQLITESAVLAVIAGALGVAIAAWGIRGLVALAPQGLPRLDEVGIDWRLLAFAMTMSLAASFVFGVAPALQISRVDLNEVLKLASRGSSGTGGRLRSWLIVFETAAAVVLVIAASLLVRSFAALTRADMGFSTERLLVADTSVPASDVDSARRAVRFYRDLFPQIATIPGVRAAAGVNGMPTNVRSNGGYMVEGGRTFEQMGTSSPQALFAVASADYFSVLGIPIRRGRNFGSGDVEGAPLVAVVNEAFVRAAFADADPIGRRIMTGMDLAVGPDGTRFTTIVGVVANLRARDPSLPPEPQIYMPCEQHPFFSTQLTLLVRTAGDPLLAAPALQQRIRALNADVPSKIGTMDDALGVAMSAPRFRTVLLGLFAALAIVLAMAGVYGIVAYTVSQRAGEMGLRMALGAQRSAIVRLTLSSGLRLAVVGVGIGWMMALAFSRVLSSMLFEIPERDPIAFGVAPVLLVGIATLASLAPALKASRVDPSIALRTE